MDYIKPIDAIKGMLSAGTLKVELTVKDLLIRGLLSGALLGFATSLALTATLQTNTPLVGALVFPVGFAMIILLGLELVTGSFALVTVAAADGRVSWRRAISNLCWVYLANLVGSVIYGYLFYLTLTMSGTDTPAPLAAKLVALAEAKTNLYAAHGAAGFLTAFVRGVLCNWMVCLGVVLPLTTSSTLGKIAAAWLPIFTFFAQGFEHSVVNMFVIPTGMMLGAKVTVSTWWMWNQLPVTLGNIVGGALFTGLFLYWTFVKAPPVEEYATVVEAQEA